MRLILLITFVLLSISKGYGQEPNNTYSYKKHHPLATIVQSQHLDSVNSLDKIVLTAFDSKVPFYHISNKGVLEKKYVILLHGLGGNKTSWLHPSMPYLQYTKNLTAVKDSLLNRGFSLVITDAKYHGERTYELNFRSPSYLPPQRSQNIDDANIFYDMIVSTVKEVRLIMDYLETVHKNHNMKFNLVGYSMGGGISLLLNSIDDRINSVVACVPPLGRPYTEVDGLDWPKEMEEKMKVISPLYSATKQKSPVAMLMGKTDFFIPEKEALAFYNEILIADKKLEFYDAGHELPKDYIEDVINWITQHNK